MVVDSMDGSPQRHRRMSSSCHAQLHELLAYLGQQGVATDLTLAQHGFIERLSTLAISPILYCSFATSIRARFRHELDQEEEPPSPNEPSGNLSLVKVKSLSASL